MPNEQPTKRKRRRRWRRNDGEVARGAYVVPNLFTTLNLLSGFYGIVSAIGGDFRSACIAIVVSCVFDILDGKVARLTGATSRFGIEYDSLADLVAFGVSPGLIMYLWALKPYGRIGWLAAFVFVACGALRLARFNVRVDVTDKRYFQGLPIPGGALVVAATCFFVSWVMGSYEPHASAVLLVLTYVLGFLMVSSVPYYSFKDLEFVKGRPLQTLFVTIVGLTVVLAKPHVMTFVIMFAYLAMGPVTLLRRRMKGPQPAVAEGAPHEGETAPAHTPPAPEGETPTPPPKP